MKNRISAFSVSTIVVPILLWAGLGLSMAEAQGVKAFPTAEGYGSDTIGGRGGKIIKVTNLNDSGPGSFRAAVMAEYPRIVVFDVSGTINLSSDIDILGPSRSYLTIAGQTSPGGVQLRGPDYGIIIGYGIHDVIVRYLRVRPGGPASGSDTGYCLIIYSPTGGSTYNIMIDHCSFEWGNDDMWGAYTGYYNVTAQWCLIAEGTTSGTNDGWGTSCLIGGWGNTDKELTISMHHNLIANSYGRVPFIQHVGIMDFRNNLIYNWRGNNSSQWGDWGMNHSAFANLVNNHYILGPEGHQPTFWVANGGPTRVGDGLPAERGGTKLYTSGNWSPARPTGAANDWENGFISIDYYAFNRDDTFRPASESQYRASTPFPAPPVATDATSAVKAKVSGAVGATKPSRDPVDSRIINEVLNGTGNIMAIGNGGPWPVLSGGPPPLDTDGDAIPDQWEIAHGLNPNKAADGSAIVSNGYTNVENYLNELAGDPIPAGKVSAPANLRIVKK